jgi:hypothetical protein
VLDVFPFRGNFRISAGARINGNQADISGTPTSNVTIGNTTYTPAQVGRLNGDIDFNTVAPYVGIGFDGHITDALTIGFDLGVLYQGKPSVSLSATNPAVSQADLNRERANIEDDLKMLQFYPVATVSLKYRFCFDIHPERDFDKHPGFPVSEHHELFGRNSVHDDDDQPPRRAVGCLRALNGSHRFIPQGSADFGRSPSCL